MALYKSLIFSEASGSVGGLVYSHNAGGQYIRARVTPTNPGTPQQAAVRQAFGGLLPAWIETLTEVQREAWRTYAAQVGLRNAFGDLRYVSGVNHYLRGNTLRVAFGFPRADDGPTIFDLGYYALPTFSVDAAADTVAVAFNPLDDWVGEDDAHMIVYASRPQNPSINYFQGPYRFAGTVAGNAVTPPTSPETIPLPWPVEVDHRVFFLVTVSRADGRRGENFRNFAVAA